MSTENKNLIKCKVCGEEIAKSAKTCPKCGAKVKKPIYKKWWFIAIVIVAIIIAISSAGGSKDTTETTNTSNVSAPQETIEYTKYDVSTLLDELEGNALSAEEKHNKEYVEITGKLEVIDSDGKYISLSPTGSMFSITNAQCYLKNDEHKTKVMSMSKGDTVTLTGQIKSVGELLGYQIDIHEIK